MFDTSFAVLRFPISDFSLSILWYYCIIVEISRCRDRKGIFSCFTPFFYLQFLPYLFLFFGIIVLSSDPTESKNERPKRPFQLFDPIFFICNFFPIFSEMLIDRLKEIPFGFIRCYASDLELFGSSSLPLIESNFFPVGSSSRDAEIGKGILLWISSVLIRFSSIRLFLSPS